MKNKYTSLLATQSFFMMVLAFFSSCDGRDGFATAPDFLKKEWELTGDEHNIDGQKQCGLGSERFKYKRRVFLDSENWDEDERLCKFN